MTEKAMTAVFVFVAVVAVGGLVLTETQNATIGFIVSDVVKHCKTVNKGFENCVTPNGGCQPGYPKFKQYMYKIEGIPTCCCVPHYSNLRDKVYGGSLYQ